MSDLELVELFEPENMDACFTAFDKDGDDHLNLQEFECICRAIFRSDKGKIYSLEPDQLQEVFNIFDQNKDGLLDREEFIFCWHNWIKTVPGCSSWGNQNFTRTPRQKSRRSSPCSSPSDFLYPDLLQMIKPQHQAFIVRPVSVFLIVDVQNDFISGTLNISNCAAQQNGLEVIEPINRLLETVNFDAVFYSLDWHPSDHVSFIDNLPQRAIHPSSAVTAENAKVYDTVTFEGPPLMKQRLWPRHCVQDSWGAELHKDMKIVENGIKIYKGTNSEVDSYSVFWDNKKLTKTTLVSQLSEKGATDIYVCGLAYDVCVGATAVDALSIGYRTILLDDCCRGVDLEDIEKTKKTVISNHGVIVNSNMVKAMVEGRDRRPELGYKLALELKAKLKALETDSTIENSVNIEN